MALAVTGLRDAYTRMAAACAAPWRRLRASLGVNAGIAIFSLTVIGSVLGSVIANSQSERQKTIDNAVRQNSNLALAFEEHTIRTLKGVDAATLFLKQDFERRGTGIDLGRYLANSVVDGKLATAISVFDERGNMVASTHELRSGNFSAREHYAAHVLRDSGQLYISKPVVGRISGEWSIYLTRRVNKADGSFGGVVSMTVDPHYFTRFYQQTDLGQRGLVSLVGLDGISRVRQAGSAASFGQDVARSGLFVQLAGKSVGSFVSGGAVEGVPRFMSFRAVAGYPLIVVVGTAQDEVLAEHLSQRDADLASVALFSAVIVFFSVLLMIAMRRQKRAVGALAASNVQFRATFEQAAVGIAHIELDGRFVRLNQKLCDMLGYSRDELLKLTVVDITHPDERGIDAHRRAGVLAGDIATYTVERRCLRSDGTVIWVNRTVSLVRDDAGRPAYFIRVMEDITERKKVEERFRVTFEQAAVGISHDGVDGRFQQVNQKLCDMLGYTRDELLAKTARDVTHADDREINAHRRARILAGEMSTYSAERRCLRKDGSLVWVNQTVSLVRDAAGTPLHFVRVVEDITERKAAESALRTSEETLRATFSQAGVGIIITSPVQRYLQVNDKYCDMLGYSREELLGMSNTAVLVPQQLDSVIENCRKLIRGELQSISSERQLVRKDRSLLWIHQSTSLARDPGGGPRHFITVVADISERKRAEQQLTHLAHHDGLTGLPNRGLFHDRLGHALDQARRRNWIAGVMFVDLDRFKAVNDTLGHDAGDQLLREAAARLAQCVRSDDTVGRLGGDEFAVILTELARVQDAGLVAQKIITALAAPFAIGGKEVFITASVGIATYPGDADTAAALIKNADAAMYRIKGQGKNNFQFYTATMNARAAESLQLENDLRYAIQRDEFVLHFQPKADLASGRVTGVEALLRWQRPDGRLVAPAEFIPLLEDSGLIVPAGAWVLRAACAQIYAWRKAGLAPVPIAVNLSAKQFHQQDICAVVEGALEEYNVDARLLELEITESAAMHDAKAATAMLRDLKAIGVHIAIDDFGTGYSSLSYLKRFPIDSLKIDRSFVTELPGNHGDASIARAVITMAHSLGLKVVAEGVENEAQLAFLAQHGCDEIQGYYFSRPLPAELCTQLLRAQRTLPLPADNRRNKRRVLAAVT